VYARAWGFIKKSLTKASAVVFYDIIPSFIKIELRRRCSCYIYRGTRLKRRKGKKEEEKEKEDCWRLNEIRGSLRR